jgi:hypothetical protein
MVGGDVPWKKYASDSSFGHTGAGGCVSFGDVQNEVLSRSVLFCFSLLHDGDLQCAVHFSVCPQIMLVPRFQSGMFTSFSSSLSLTLRTRCSLGCWAITGLLSSSRVRTRARLLSPPRASLQRASCEDAAARVAPQTCARRVTITRC